MWGDNGQVGMEGYIDSICRSRLVAEALDYINSCRYLCHAAQYMYVHVHAVLYCTLLTHANPVMFGP